ncbi:hypothetical protein KOI35_13385 [Actinoplanes bogorensis]|uniref:Secreted protein n=1 Tax=Paractinoplanes bogorensis TaxID=1610840 RepID=A0ABS5YM26_9ACTN|nr:hypothetical protein [Actinoplanes bogorensis]MBU2664490.1 hypothetical protein [Actinoplanes bogorensis]
MSIRSALAKAAVALPLAAALIAGSAQAASATSAYSPKSSFTNGAALQSYVYVATWASGNCAAFDSWSQISGGSAPVSGRDWVKVATTFDPWGVQASVTAFGRSGDPVTGTWQNNNGSRGAFLSGNLCTNIFTVGVSARATGTAFYNGQTKSVTASF